jgi:hypothetical protein
VDVRWAGRGPRVRTALRLRHRGRRWGKQAQGEGEFADPVCEMPGNTAEVREGAQSRVNHRNRHSLPCKVIS